MVKFKVLQWCIDEHGLIRPHDPLLQGVPLSPQADCSQSADHSNFVCHAKEFGFYSKCNWKMEEC